MTFSSTSKRGDSGIAGQTWDLNGDGAYDDATSAIAQAAFPSAGSYRVRLRVTDTTGASSSTSRMVRVSDAPPPAPPPPPTPPAPPPAGNLPPTASFTFAPASPLTGQTIVFTSTSTDPDGTVSKLTWDLDGDGKFGDASGRIARKAFVNAGTQTVTLRATDDAGASSTAFQTVTIRSGAPAPPPPPPGTSAAPLITPFPIVRIRGVILRRGVRLNLFTVHTVRHALVSIRCKGPGCPRRSIRVRVPTARHPLRIRRLERSLRAGVVLEIRVTLAGRTGKYTRFTIRRGAPPARRDLCISPASARPVRCPAPPTGG